MRVFLLEMHERSKSPRNAITRSEHVGPFITKLKSLILDKYQHTACGEETHKDTAVLCNIRVCVVDPVYAAII